MGFLDKLFGRTQRETANKRASALSLGMHIQRDFHSKIAGASNYQDAIKHCKAGERLWLVREPNNPYDRNAISVWNQGKELIGYIGKDLAADLAGQMDRGQWIEVTVSELTGGTPDKPHVGCNIHITFQQVEDI